MSDPRTNRPAEVERELRRRGGFGCCVCGRPVIQYHHIIPWSVEQHYRVDDMMILCPYCHDAATKGAMSERAQRRAQASPFNMSQGYAAGNVMIDQDYCAVAFGGVLLVGDGPGIFIDDIEVLRLSAGPDGDLQLNLDLRDEDGKQLAQIDRNEWIAGEPGLWDMTSDHQKLKIWQGEREIALEINAKGTPVRVRADLWHRGHLVRLNSAGLTWGGKLLGGGFADLGLVGLSLLVDTAKEDVTMKPYNGQAMFVSRADPMERLSDSVNAWRRITAPALQSAFTPNLSRSPDGASL